MYILTKSVLAMMISFIISIIIGFLLVPVLKKLHVSQRISIYVSNMHKNKNGTPTMGGLIFIIAVIITIILLLILKKINLNYNFLIIIFTFISYSIIGFIDDFLIIKRKNNKGLTELQKLFLQIIVAIIFFYLFMLADNEPILWIKFLKIRISMGWLYGLFILFVLVSSSNAVNITDGLDGLASGLSIIAFLSFGILTWSSGWLDGYQEIAIFCFILIGSLLGFLVFNLNPAKVFMGDTGSLALGATLGAVAIITRYEFLLILIGIVFVLETSSCIIQIIYYKLTKKRFFPMTPIHHSFEKMGWNERDIVKLFWIIGLIANMLALIFFVWL